MNKKRRILILMVQPDSPQYRFEVSVPSVNPEATAEELLTFGNLVNGIQNDEDELAAVRVYDTDYVVEEA